MLDEGPPTGPCFILTLSGMMPSPDGWGFNMGIVEEIQLTTDGRDGRDGRDTVAVGFIFSVPVLIPCGHHHGSSQGLADRREVHNIKYGSDEIWVYSCTSVSFWKLHSIPRLVAHMSLNLPHSHFPHSDSPSSSSLHGLLGFRWPSQIMQNNLPILRTLNLITFAKSPGQAGSLTGVIE